MDLDVFSLGQIPTPPAGAIESWLISAAAIMAIVVLAKKLFIRRPPIEAEFVTQVQFTEFKKSVTSEIHGVQEKFEGAVNRIFDKIDQTKTDLIFAGQQRSREMHERINELQVLATRVDERTRSEQRNRGGE